MADHNPFRKGTRPDEVFENPFFRMERAGRFIKIETHRTPEQQAALVKSVLENRHRLLERATEYRKELKALIQCFTSLDVLAHQIAQDIMRDPNQYREMDSELRPHLIEYLALLELEDTEYEVRAIESPSPSDVAKTRELLEGIFEAFQWQIMTEHITEENQGALSVQQELRYHALMYHVFVRSPVLVDVHAVGINPGEAFIRKTRSAEPGGRVLLGWEFAGMIVAARSGVHGFKVGDRVFGTGDMTRDGSWVKTAGLAFVKQRPGTASGVVFIDLGDETGDFRIFVAPDFFERNRRVIQRAKFIGVEGPIQKEGPIIHVMARSLYELSVTSSAGHLKVESHDFH